MPVDDRWPHVLDPEFFVYFQINIFIIFIMQFNMQFYKQWGVKTAVNSILHTGDLFIALMLVN